jgi:hypothetical protein
MTVTIVMVISDIRSMCDQMSLARLKERRDFFRLYIVNSACSTICRGRNYDLFIDSRLSRCGIDLGRSPHAQPDETFVNGRLAGLPVGTDSKNIQRAIGKIGTFKPKQAVLRNEAAATLWQIGQFGERDKTFASAVVQKRTGR